MSLRVYVCICTLVLKGKMGDQCSLQACEKLFLYIKPFLLLSSSVDPWTKEQAPKANLPRCWLPILNCSSETQCGGTHLEFWNSEDRDRRIPDLM